jgi:poly-gamma-glutamate capsule biosynthesis protein CapA/YwtB (metallophosphatase superfamily)
MSDQAGTLCLFLAGDVMTGRGIDQVLAHSGRPDLHESMVRDARHYVRLAELAHGPIPHPAPSKYIWGEALHVLERAGAEVRIVNLETSITSCDEHWPGKGIHYRMHPGNISCIKSAGIDCCSLANNHVLDWGYPGLGETLRTLDRVGVAHAGAGENLAEARAPAIVAVPGKGRVLVYSFGETSSGIPLEWAASPNRPGINLLDTLSEDSVREISGQIRRAKQVNDIVIVSIHWGGNWGYDVPREHIEFAHRLVEEGADVVHGHSSHHVRGIDVYRDRLILYGAGDFVTDYEGIRGYEYFRGDLALMYLVLLDPRNGRLVGTRLVPLQSRRFRLQHVSRVDAKWLADLLNRLGIDFGTYVKLGENELTLEWRND